MPNRPPSLTVNPIKAGSARTNSNTITVRGSAADAENNNNNVQVFLKINYDDSQQVYDGAPGAWTFNVLLNDLKKGANALTIEVRDMYNAVIFKVLTVNKTHNAVPLNWSTIMYKIDMPIGSATKFLMWVEHLISDLAVTAEVSMTNAGEPENFVPLINTNMGRTQ